MSTQAVRSQATIAHIAPVKNGIGIVYREELPADLLRLEFKYCEVCGGSFVREFAPTEVYKVHTYRLYSVAGCSQEHPAELRRDHGERFCKSCRGRQLQPDVLSAENYLVQMPGTRRQMGHSTSVPKYDLQKNDRRRTTRAEIMRKAAEWKIGVLAAFRAKGTLTTEDMAELIPDALTPSNAYARVKMVFELVMVSRDRVSITGRGRGVSHFALKETIQ